LTASDCRKPYWLCINRFVGKLNEVAMVLRVNENDTRCPFVAGMEDIPIEEIICPRLCVLTNKPYPCSSFRRDQGCAFPASLSKKEVKQQIFYGGRLACRVVYTLFVSKNGKPYSGIVRRLYAKEADTVESARPTQGPGSSRIEPIPVDDDGDKNPPFVDHNLSGFGKKRAQSDDTQGTKKRRSPLPTKEGSFTFGDVFCGAGGASQGAWQAGLHIKWGLDNDEDAISAYGMNHPGALPFRRNAHNFPPRGHTNDELRVDVLHLSPPCCFFSPAQLVHLFHNLDNLFANVKQYYQWSERPG
jgi:DNA (cytosine-5)-methyltransferase 1